MDQLDGAVNHGSPSDGSQLPFSRSQQRQFNIDVTPQLFFNAGPLVDVLRTSGVGKYLEFRTFDKFLFLNPDGLKVVRGCAFEHPHLMLRLGSVDER